MILELKDVERIWGGVLSMAKPWFQSGVFLVKTERKGGAEYSDDVWPEFYPGFNKVVDERASLKVHTEPGNFPERLYKYRAPNSTDKELDYIRANHKQITLPVYTDFENTILRGMNDQNWSIKYGRDLEVPDELHEQFKKYVEEGIPEFGSVVSYVKNVVPKLKMNDPMGVILTMPDLIPTIEGESGPVIDPEVLLEPVPYYFECTEVWGFKLDEWYLIRSREKSMVRVGTKDEPSGLVMIMVDDMKYWRIEQTGKRNDLKFIVTEWFEHGLGYPPCIHLMGDICVTDGRLRWQSPYLAARELLDIVLLDNSYLNLSKATACFPFRVMLGDQCDFEMNGSQCNNGKITQIDEEGNATIAACPLCKDTPGLKSRLSPAGVILVKPGDALNPDGETKGIPTVLQWVSPPMDTLGFLREEIRNNTNEARKIMHLSSDGTGAGGGPDVKTATQSGIDHRAMYAFVGPIVDQFFKVMQFLFDSIGGIRYGASYKGVELHKPTTFDIRTEADLIEELKNSSLLPPIITDTVIWSYIRARFSQNPGTLKAFETIAFADKMFSAKASDMGIMKSEGVIEPWQVVLHYQAIGLYDQLEATGKLTGVIEKDAEALKALAQESTPEAQEPPALQLLRGAGRT